MKEHDTNIYRISRKTAGYTQERWAEMLGVAVESVRHWENGDWIPGDDNVTAMVQISCMPIIAYWHLQYKSRIANDELPELERLPLPQAVVRLLTAMKAMQPDLDSLLMISSDGFVSGAETELFEQIAHDLDGVIKASLEVKYAEGVNNG